MPLTHVLACLAVLTAAVVADHHPGYHHHAPDHHHHQDYHHSPYYQYEYGVHAYGPGYGGHGDPGPLHYKVQEHRQGYDTKGSYHVELPGKSYKHLTYSVNSQHHG